MTDPITPDPTEPTPSETSSAGDSTPRADETFSWTNESTGGDANEGEHDHDATGSTTSGAAATATSRAACRSPGTSPT